MRVIISVLVVILSTWAISGLGETDSVPKTEAFEKQLRGLEAPLKVELEKRGLAEIDARTVAKKAVDSLITCSKSQTEDFEPLFDDIIIRLGGKTIVTAGTPCIFEFLELAGVSKG